MRKTSTILLAAVLPMAVQAANTESVTTVTLSWMLCSASTMMVK